MIPTAVNVSVALDPVALDPRHPAIDLMITRPSEYPRVARPIDLDRVDATGWDRLELEMRYGRRAASSYRHAHARRRAWHDALRRAGLGEVADGVESVVPDEDLLPVLSIAMAEPYLLSGAWAAVQLRVLMWSGLVEFGNERRTDVAMLKSCHGSVGRWVALQCAEMIEACTVSMARAALGAR